MPITWHSISRGFELDSLKSTFDDMSTIHCASVSDVDYRAVRKDRNYQSHDDMDKLSVSLVLSIFLHLPRRWCSHISLVLHHQPYMRLPITTKVTVMQRTLSLSKGHYALLRYFTGLQHVFWEQCKTDYFLSTDATLEMSVVLPLWSKAHGYLSN